MCVIAQSYFSTQDRGEVLGGGEETAVMMTPQAGRSAWKAKTPSRLSGTAFVMPINAWRERKGF